MSAQLNQRIESELTTAKPVRLLIVAPSFDILGGQSVQAHRLMSRLRDEAALDVHFLPINPRLPGILRGLQRIKYVRTIVTSVAYVLSLLTQVPKYDVLHVFSASYLSFVLAPTPAILIGKLFGKRVLLNYHSGEAEDHLTRWHRTAIPTIRLADLVVVPSEYLVRVFSRFGLEAHAINNLIDTSRFRFRERRVLQPRFLQNRNFERHYGVDVVLRAFAIIQQAFPAATLTVAGDGNERAALEQLTVELKLQNVNFVGQVDPDSIVELYDAADIYLNGSEIDNQPLSILEAFACGLPIVTTGAGGIPDIVKDRLTGFIVPCGDHQQLAARAIELLEQPQVGLEMTLRGLQECRQFSWEAVRDGWMGCYQQLSLGRREETLQVTEKASTPRPDVASR